LVAEDKTSIDTKEFDQLTSLFSKAYEKEVDQIGRYQGLFLKALESKLLVKSVVDNAHSFSEYLDGLINLHRVDLDDIYTIVEIDSQTLEGLRQGSIPPWYLQHSQVFALLRVINGLYKDALEKIKTTEIYIDENRAKSTDLGLVARSQGMSNANRREMFSNKTIKFLKIAEQRKKNELIEVISNELN